MWCYTTQSHATVHSTIQSGILAEYLLRYVSCLAFRCPLHTTAAKKSLRSATLLGSCLGPAGASSSSASPSPTSRTAAGFFAFSSPWSAWPPKPRFWASHPAFPSRHIIVVIGVAQRVPALRHKGVGYRGATDRSQPTTAVAPPLALMVDLF